MRRRLAFACALLSLLALASAPAAWATAAEVDAAMLSAINEERGKRGLAPLAATSRLTRSCRRYASRMLSDNRWAHAGSTRVKGIGRVAEVLGRNPGRPAIGAVVKAWLRSPTHRKVLLSRRYRRVGVAHRTGRMDGRKMTIWVVRFAR